MQRRIEVRGAAHLELVDGVTLLDPEAQVFEAMLDGWRSQQLSRNLTFATIDTGARVVSRFCHDTGVWPWEWTPGQLEGWCAELRERKLRAPSTVRSYQLAVRSFLAYVVDPVYGWDRQCLEHFGTHAVQIAGRDNLAVHAADYEGDPGRRALTRVELQDLFDAADDTVADIRARHRKGWLPAFRDATMLKAAYGWGLRRRELLMLEVADFGSNPTAANPGSSWLFPGYTPGQPIQARELARRLAIVDVTRLGRLGALKHLVAEVPAPVLGELIGYSPRIVAKHAMDQAVDWNAYAALKARDRHT